MRRGTSAGLVVGDGDFAVFRVVVIEDDAVERDVAGRFAFCVEFDGAEPRAVAEDLDALTAQLIALGYAEE